MNLNVHVNLNVYVDTGKQVSLPRPHQQTFNIQRMAVLWVCKILQIKLSRIVVFSTAHQKWETPQFLFDS